MILSQIPDWAEQLNEVITDDIGRIAWNSFLALFPLTLSYFLFNKPRLLWVWWTSYILLGFSFIIGIKKYNNGDILASIKTGAVSLWGVRAFFLAIALGLIIVLMTIDIKSRVGKENDRSISWWLGLLLFIGFLPNAPYILTDIIHFYDAIRAINSVWTITLVILPIYLIFISIGWFSYVFSLLNVGKYLQKIHLDRYINITELSLHLLCAIGIYIGRFLRFNSWSLLASPKDFLKTLPLELIGKFPIVVMLLTFLIIMGLYSIAKFMIQRLSINPN